MAIKTKKKKEETKEETLEEYAARRIANESRIAFNEDGDLVKITPFGSIHVIRKAEDFVSLGR